MNFGRLATKYQLMLSFAHSGVLELMKNYFDYFSSCLEDICDLEKLTQSWKAYPNISIIKNGRQLFLTSQLASITSFYFKLCHNYQ